ncbi:hypothetical protein ABZ250_02225 [Streptomyces afghaniensis]|uniref:hypothetical protein n=1 Tax=Streptomyces afghaniensis TaxID=66865 RepID=UPI0033A4DE1E
MTARNDDDRRDAEYDGMDALMAVLVGDPLPEGARRDPTFMTAHRAAAADVALLREQLLLMGDTLAHDAAADVADPETEPRTGTDTGARTRTEAADPPGGPPTDGPRPAHAAGPGAVVGLSPEPGDPPGRARMAGQPAAGPGAFVDPSPEAVGLAGGVPDGPRAVRAGAPEGDADAMVPEPEAGARARTEAAVPPGRAPVAGPAGGVPLVRAAGLGAFVDPSPEAADPAGEAPGDGPRAVHAGAPEGDADAMVPEPEAGARGRVGEGDPAGRAPAAGPAGGVPLVHAGAPEGDADAKAPEPEAGAWGRVGEGDPGGLGPAAGPPAHAAGPGAGGPAVTVLPVGARAHGGQSGRRSRSRGLGVVLRGLVAAVAATVVAGMGWLVVQGDHGAADDAGSGSAADAAAGPARGQEGAKLGHAGYLACARLVAEGTVVEVEPVPGTRQDRVTLDVDRSYKPAKGQDRIVFPMDEDAAPRPRPGDHVLVGFTRGQAQPDLWSVGEKEIAPERAWITAALPESATLPCE